MFLERFIHGEAFKARPDVNAVVHSHSPTVIPFSVTDEPLRAVSSVASFLACGCPVFEIREPGITKGLLVTTIKQGAALAKVLGDKPVALLRGHGNIVVAPDIPRVVHRALYTEVNAQQLATALSFRRPIKYIEPDEMLDPQRLGDSWEVWKPRDERRVEPPRRPIRALSPHVGRGDAATPQTIANASISTMNSGRDSRAT